MRTPRDFALYRLEAVERKLGIDGLGAALDELEADREPIDDLEQAVAGEDFFRTKSWDSVYDLGLYRIVLYALARRLRPSLWVETGVLHGITTNFTLTAIRRNGEGTLVSVDYPSYFEKGPSNQDGFDDTLPPGREPGWVIPDKNRPHWELRLGPSGEELPKVIERGTPIDVFLHDSEHTYDTMTTEFELAWDALAPDGLLLADNIVANDAWDDFCRRVGREPLLFPEGNGDPDANEPVRFGLLRRSGD